MKAMKGFMIVFAVIVGMLFVTGCGAAPGGGSFSASIAVDHNTTSLQPDTNVTLKVTVSGGEAKSFSWADNNDTIEGETEKKLVYHITKQNLGDHNITVKVVANDGSKANASVTIKTITTDEEYKLEFDANNTAGAIMSGAPLHEPTLKFTDGHTDVFQGDIQAVYDPEQGKEVLGHYPCPHYPDPGRRGSIKPGSSYQNHWVFYKVDYSHESGGNFEPETFVDYCSESGLYDLNVYNGNIDEYVRYNGMARFRVNKTPTNNTYIQFWSIYNQNWDGSNNGIDQYEGISPIVYIKGLVPKHGSWGIGVEYDYEWRIETIDGRKCIVSEINTYNTSPLNNDEEHYVAHSKSWVCPKQSIQLKIKDLRR